MRSDTQFLSTIFNSQHSNTDSPSPLRMCKHSDVFSPAICSATTGSNLSCTRYWQCALLAVLLKIDTKQAALSNSTIQLNYFRSIRIALTLSVLLPGCTNQQLFNAIRVNNLQQCEEIPIPQQGACKAQYKTDYEDYRLDIGAIECEERLDNGCFS